MSATPQGWRCAAASLARNEPVAGTATHVRTWLLLEHVGPWGPTALRDARLPEGLGAALQQRARDHKAKVLLIRRYNSKPDDAAGLRVFAAYADPLAPRLESGLLRDPREVLDLDLGALRAGGTTGLPAYDDPLFCVCTNGRHDACCAERGRPVAAALDAVHPGQTWEISHIGGDRFAGNMVVLPHGLYYGRLDPESAVGVAERHLGGELSLDRLRGRSSHPMPVQAAEIALRRQVGVTGLQAVALTGRRSEGGVTVAEFVVEPEPEAAVAAYRVTVRTSPDPAARLTCKATRDSVVPLHEIVAIERMPLG